MSRLIELNESIKLPEEEPGYKFGYTSFKELPPAKVTVIEEVIINKNQGDQLPGSLKIQHNDPVVKDIEIKLPLMNSRMKELQEQDPLVGQLRKQWSEKKLDKKHFTMENEILKKEDSNKQHIIHPHSGSICVKRLSTDIMHMTSRATMDSKELTVHSSSCTTGKV